MHILIFEALLQYLSYMHTDEAKSMEEPAQSSERANPFTSSAGGVPVDLVVSSCLNKRMATLDSDDLKAIKDLMEVTIDEAIDKKEVVTKKRHQPSSN